MQSLPPLPVSFGINWNHPNLKNAVEFINLAISICNPAKVEIFDGSAESYYEVCQRLVHSGLFMPLNPYEYPNSYVARSNPIDVARSEDRTFICLKDEEHLYTVPHADIPSDLGFTWGCRAGEVDLTTKKEIKTEEMRARLFKEFDKCMSGRTLFIIPFSMGPVNSPYAKLAIQISDSLYVIANMYIMVRTGLSVLKKISEGASFVPCWHSVGVPLVPGEKDVAWPCRLYAKDRYITHFMTADPKMPALGPYSIMSIGSGYGGNAILGKKCYALRIASKMGRDDEKDKWMAEHMLILRVKYTPLLSNIGGKKTFGPAEYFTVTGAFPSACGKTNLAMIEVPAEYTEEWSVSCIGDDIAWIRVENTAPPNTPPTYQFCAINAESGFFGVAPGTSDHSNKNAMATLRNGNCIFTNVAVSLDGLVHWEDKEDLTHIPDVLVDWKGKRIDVKKDVEVIQKKYHAEFPNESASVSEPAVAKLVHSKLKAVDKTCAHANSRYTMPCANCPIIDPLWNTGKGYPIDAILFGGRRTLLMPLAVRLPSWEQGVLQAATLRSEGTAAVQDRKTGALVFDPMAMRPFIGYNVGDYFQHWFDMGARLDTLNNIKTGEANPYKPGIYLVNWFRKDPVGKFLWDGFSQNFRIVRWACLHAREQRALAKKEKPAQLIAPTEVLTPLGYAPTLATLGLESAPSSSSQTTTPVPTPVRVTRSPLHDESILSILPIAAPPTVPPTGGEATAPYGKGTTADWEVELADRKRFLELLKGDLPHAIKVQFNTLVDAFINAGCTKLPTGLKFTV